MSNFVCFHAMWNEIKTPGNAAPGNAVTSDAAPSCISDGKGLDEVAMEERADIVTAFLGEYPFTHFENESGWVKAL